jgi:hypothetical protein
MSFINYIVIIINYKLCHSFIMSLIMSFNYVSMSFFQPESLMEGRVGCNSTQLPVHHNNFNTNANKYVQVFFTHIFLPQKMVSTLS